VRTSVPCWSLDGGRLRTVGGVADIWIGDRTDRNASARPPVDSPSSSTSTGARPSPTASTKAWRTVLMGPAGMPAAR
ncbi:uncharacterized protein METZ01_LOCUS166416, partial [marine metagenome]